MAREIVETRTPLRRLAAMGGAAVLAVAAAAYAAPVFAQDAAAPSPDDWIKICNTDPKTKKQICITNQELRTDDGQFMASVAIREISGEERKVLLIAVPPGMLIQPGLRVQVDNGKQEQAKYSICFPNACYAEMVMSDAAVGQYKKGSNLVLTTLNQQAKPVSFPISLNGFTKVYEGPALDPAALQARQEKLESELQKRADEARKKLIEEQRKAQEQPAQ
jgi:invasion protein IalB